MDTLVVVVRIFNATRHPRHMEAAAIVMYLYLYSLAFMDHPCTLGAAVCHQAPLCPLYTQPRARRVWARRTNGLKIISTPAGFEPTISRMKVECTSPLDTLGWFSAICTRETTLVTSWLAFLRTKPVLNSSTLKGRTFLPMWAKYFLLEQIPCS